VKKVGKIKKSENFMKSDWTVCTMLTIIIGSFAWTLFGQVEKQSEKKPVEIQKKEESELETAEKKIASLEGQLKVVKEELSVIRKELASLLNESEVQDEAYARLQMSIAASLAEGNKKSYDKESAELLKVLKEISEKGDELVTSSAEFCDFIDVILDKKKITDVEKVRAKFRMDKLRTNAELLHARINPPPESKLFKECRILAVNDKLQVVVLGIGSVYGMRNGILLRTGKEKKVRLKVIAVRPFISGAMIVEGNIEKLAPGMFAETGQ
jgi:hypothetical protein